MDFPCRGKRAFWDRRGQEPNFLFSVYTEKVAKELGGTIKVAEFVRMEKCEGIEKKQENFADEVAKQMAGK